MPGRSALSDGRQPTADHISRKAQESVADDHLQRAGAYGHRVKKLVRRLGIVSTSALLLALSVAAPGYAATPYTPEAACSTDFGGTWSRTSDGHRTLTAEYSGAKWGDVYLMYNRATGDNCVATVKTKFLGTGNSMDARVFVQGASDWKRDQGYYNYYAAVRVSASGKCVKYDGAITTSSDYAMNGRYTWGNCG